jgi:hypothetical protein
VKRGREGNGSPNMELTCGKFAPYSLAYMEAD